jgi:hypothetical protein
MQEIGRGRPPMSVLLGAGKTAGQFDAGSHLTTGALLELADWLQCWVSPVW